MTFDSEYGPDLRQLTGWVTATPDPAGASGGCTRYVLQFEFDWHVKDAVDFCPGNTEPWNAFVHDAGMLHAMSRLEASGMARDISVEANYRRTRTLDALFCRAATRATMPASSVARGHVPFPVGASIPDTDDNAVFAELERAYGGRGLPELDRRVTALNVVGHTDSRGEDHGFDNVGLSRARAQFVADLVARYPADHSTHRCFPPVASARSSSRWAPPERRPPTATRQATSTADTSDRGGARHPHTQTGGWKSSRSVPPARLAAPPPPIPQGTRLRATPGPA